MVKVYADLIILKRKTFDKVPARLQDAVRLELAERGYDTNGDPIVSE